MNGGPRPRWVFRLATLAGLSLAFNEAGCRSAQPRIPQPGAESTPEDTPGAAERESLGSLSLQPSAAPARPGAPAEAAHTESADGGSMEPARTHWFRALRGKLDDAGASDAPGEERGERVAPESR